MKKVIIGLVVLVVILALSNLGTSFASAILAKDSTTNDQNELVSTKTGEALATDQTVTTFIAQQQPSETSSTRDLEAAPAADKEYIATNTQMIEEDALEMLMKCEEGTRDITLTVQSESSETVTKTKICPAPTGCKSEFTLDVPSNKPTAGVLCLSADDKLWVQPDPVNSGYYIVSETEVVQSTVACNEPVCVMNEDMGSATRYNCAAEAPEDSIFAAAPVDCPCFPSDKSGFDPNDSCYEKSCPEAGLCIEFCATGHAPGECCTCPSSPTSQAECVSDSWTYFEAGGICCDTGNGWTYNGMGMCIQCDAKSGGFVLDGVCTCPDGKTIDDNDPSGSTCVDDPPADGGGDCAGKSCIFGLHYCADCLNFATCDCGNLVCSDGSAPESNSAVYGCDPV